VIVLDASAAVEWLLQTDVGVKVERKILAPGERLHAPHLLDVEVAQALRRFVATGGLTSRRAQEALDDLLDLSITRCPHDVLLERIWMLRENLTAYDAAYVALAEALGATLVTCDSKMGASPGHSARIEVI